MNRSAIRNLPKRALALTLAAALLCPAASANAGSTQLDTAQELADGLTYRNTVSNHSAAGRMESFSLELEPDSDVYPIMIQAAGTVYGAATINRAIRTAQELGYHVVGGINSDFFTMGSGIPNGIAIEDGVYKSSPEGEHAVSMVDGALRLSASPQVEITVTNERTGESVSLTHFNKWRDSAGGLYLFNEDFSTVSTHTESAGGRMIRMELTAEDIETICQMPKLEELSIYECYSDDDFAFLPRLTSLKSLDWTLNNGEQLVHLTDCTQLTSLRIGWGDGNLVSSNLDFLAGMTDLESLDIHVYGLEDTSALANLTKLTHFTIAGGQIRADMSVLAGMTEMVELQINSSNIRSSYPPYDKNGYVAPDLSFMANMSKLESAYMYFQENVNSIAGLEGAVNLRDLDMSVGGITTLEPFSSLTSLRKLELDVDASNLSLEPLRGLEKLETFVTYSSRDFTDWSALDHVPSVDIRA